VSAGPVPAAPEDGVVASTRSGGVVGAGVVGIGVDAVDVARYRRVLVRTPGIAVRTFTAGELEYARRQADPTPRLAARFAAKEATMKSLGVGLGACKLHDIEVARDDGGQPHLVLHRAAQELADARGVDRFLLTMTHTEAVAIAYVTALGPRR
jgi:holo-[acyl-carrier protein] synthase